jgi:hypothetical protein
LRDLGVDHVAGPADDLLRERDVLVDRLVGQELVILEDAPDIAPQLRDLPGAEAGDVAAGDDDAAGGRVLLAQQQPKRRRLPRARRPDDEDEFALADVEGDVAQRDDVALVDLGDTFESNHLRPSSGAERERFEQRAAECFGGG